MNNYIIFFVILFIFISNVIQSFIPHWTRRTENFGVSIPEHLYERADFKQMRKNYTIVLNVANFIAFLVFVLLLKSLSETAVIAGIFIYLFAFIAFGFLYYLRFHFKMKQVKQTEDWFKDKEEVVIIDTKFSEEKLVHSSGWFLVPLLIVVLTVMYTMSVYDDIPNEIPIHTSFSGEVTYDEKSIKTLLILPSIQLFLIVVFFFVNFVIKHSKQQVSAQNPEVSKKQNILFRRRWSLYNIITAIMMTLMMSYSQFTFIYPALKTYEDFATFGVLGAMFVGMIVLTIFTGQGGSRIKVDRNRETTRVERDDDKYWKLGQFYFNKNDPSIFVEKRFGIGWTNNWAHPISWILLIVIIALPLIIIFLLM